MDVLSRVPVWFRWERKAELTRRQTMPIAVAKGGVESIAKLTDTV